jgi:hypothetical protein
MLSRCQNPSLVRHPAEDGDKAGRRLGHRINLQASLEDFNAAHDSGFRTLVGQPAWNTFKSFPTLYEVVHEGNSSSLLNG